MEITLRVIVFKVETPPDINAFHLEVLLCSRKTYDGDDQSQYAEWLVATVTPADPCDLVTRELTNILVNEIFSGLLVTQ